MTTLPQLSVQPPHPMIAARAAAPLHPLSTRLEQARWELSSAPAEIRDRMGRNAAWAFPFHSAHHHITPLHGVDPKRWWVHPSSAP